MQGAVECVMPAWGDVVKFITNIGMGSVKMV